MTRLKTQCVFLFKNQEKFVIRIKGKKIWDLFLNSPVKQQPIHTAKLALSAPTGHIMQGRCHKLAGDRGLSMCKPTVCVGVQ